MISEHQQGTSIQNEFREVRYQAPSRQWEVLAAFPKTPRGQSLFPTANSAASAIKDRQTPAESAPCRISPLQAAT